MNKEQRLLKIRALRERKDPILFKRVNMLLARKKHKSIRERLWNKHHKLFQIDMFQYARMIRGHCDFCKKRFIPSGPGIVRNDIEQGFYWDNLLACCDTCRLSIHEPFL